MEPLSDDNKATELQSRFKLTQDEVNNDERLQWMLAKMVSDAEFISQLKANLPPQVPEEKRSFYSKDTLESYASRYALTLDDMRDPKWSKFVNSKIDSDVFIRQQTERMENLEASLARVTTILKKRSEALLASQTRAAR